MRRLIILLFLITIISQSYGQDKSAIVVGGNYFFIANQGIRTDSLVKQIGANKLPENFEIRYGQRVNVNSITDDSVYFVYVNYDSLPGTNDISENVRKQFDTAQAKKRELKTVMSIKSLDGSDTLMREQLNLQNEIWKIEGNIEQELYKVRNDKYVIYNFRKDGKTKAYKMSKLDFLEITKPFYRRFRGFRFGAYTVPIRLRTATTDSLGTKNFEFNSNLSLGANIIGRFSPFRKQEHLYADLSLGVGITKVDLNSSNSDLGEGIYDSIEVLSPSAFTVTGGALFNLAKNVNFGLYLGWDFLSSADQKTKWVHNKKPWLGIGINISLVGEGNKNNAALKTNK